MPPVSQLFASRRILSPCGAFRGLPSVISLAIGWGGALLGALTATASEPAAPVYQLFTGYDFTTRLDGETCPVTILDTDKLLIGGTSTPVTSATMFSLQLQTRRKLSAALITVSRLNYHPVWSRQDQNQWVQKSVADTNAALQLAEDTVTAVEQGRPPPGAPGQRGLTSQEAYTNLDRQQEATNEDLDSIMSDSADNIYNRPELFNAVDITGRLSSPVPRTMLRLVWLCRIATRQAPWRPFWAIRFGNLDSLRPTATKLDLELTGFPPGFQLLDLKLAIFDDGEELATSRSDHRRQVDAATARRFLLDEYLAHHSTATLPPAPLRLPAPPPMPGAILLDAREPLVISVAPDGSVTDIRLTRAGGTARLGDYTSVVRQLAFYPALREGRPVAGEYRGSLGDWR